VAALAGELEMAGDIGRVPRGMASYLRLEAKFAEALM
jgi:hypothetical protein